MKLKSITLLGMAYFVFSTSVLAWDNPYESNTESYGSNSESGYESRTGTRYQYDLGNPGDRAMYDADAHAKIRDRVNPDPMKNVDRNTGQYGGGIYRK